MDYGFDGPARRSANASQHSCAMLGTVGSSQDAFLYPEWKSRLTYVTATGRAVSARNGTVGAIISAQRLGGVTVACPRCEARAASVWRRFDYFDHKLPLYFTKCRRCHRRRPIPSYEVAFRLGEAGVSDPMSILREGLRTADPPIRTVGPFDQVPAQKTAISLREAEEVLDNRRRAFGRKHPLTFEARARLCEAVGELGDANEAARLYEDLLADQIAAADPRSPAVLANRYRAAVWTALGGDAPRALDSLRALLPAQAAALGDRHVNTLVTRAVIAQLMHETGDVDAAIHALRQVSNDELRTLGSEHPATEASRRLLAQWDH